MASFPTLSIGAPTKYPLTRTLVCPTAVISFLNGEEQRYKAAPSYWKLDLSLKGLSPADRDLVTQFFIDQKGRFDSTWDITIGTVTYTGCRFESDELMWSEDRPNRFSANLSVRGKI